MLSPDALEKAGEELARVYRGIEAEMLDYLARLMLSGGGVTSRSATAAAPLPGLPGTSRRWRVSGWSC